MKNIPIGRQAENCLPPLGTSQEVSDYLRDLKVGERVVECGATCMTGCCGTVYITGDADSPIVCVLWDPEPGEKGQLGTSATWGTRRLVDAGSFSHLDDPEGPCATDGCDKDGFPGGCERAGHTPENCPGFQIGDTVRFVERHVAAGDIGVIVGRECWLNNHEAVVWDGVGEIPARVKRPFDYSLDPEQLGRFLVHLQEHNPETKDSDIGGLQSWRKRCAQLPHDYPFCTPIDLELVSRPEIEVLNDSGCLGSVVAQAVDYGISCASDTVAGARKAIASMKVHNPARSASHSL